MMSAIPARAEGACDTAATVDEALARLPKVELSRLNNGMQVAIQSVPWQSQVAVVLTYRIGSRDDPPALKGLAHVVEHMTSRGSRHLTPYEGWSLLHSEGGYIDGVTMPDTTIYVSLVPAAALPRVLWVERERMAFTLERFSPESLDVERHVVRSELRMYDATPSILFDAAAFRTLVGEQHPYASPLEGVRLLDDMGIDDVREFFQRGCRPDNAQLVIVGGVDVKFAREQAELYFGTIRNPPSVFNRGDAPLVDVKGSRRVQFKDGGTQRMFAALWWIPNPSRHERAALHLLASMLKSSIWRAVANGDRATALGVTTLHLASGELFQITADLSLAQGHGPLEATVRREIEKFWSTNVDSWLVQVRDAEIFSNVLLLEQPMELARRTAAELDFAGRPFDVAEDVSLLRSITARDVMALRGRLVHPLFGWLSQKSSGDVPPSQ